MFHFVEKYYPDHKTDENCPSVITIVEEHICEMFKVFTEHITTKRILDVEGKVS